ncbi:nuclease-related domain-containing protein [Bacillus marasmi]|uniref:nuclease-related domain-containing protein n=1 Tax=Bacillus marasmi TaxID=1926279 RepID=UPI0011C8EFD6|nr:nuclease-related domain-containing protein [Bacillus marasmi]
MIHKERTKPRILLFNEAILGRIHPNHPKIPFILDSISRHEAGYAGERKLDYYLEQLPQHYYNILNDLRLHNGHTFFQLDSVLLTFKYILLVDSKNIAGKLNFDHQFDQLIQNDETTYENPLLQGKLHARDMQQWLLTHQIPLVPIEYLVVLTNKNCLIQSVDDPATQFRVCRGRSVIGRIEGMTNQYANAPIVFTSEQCQRLIELFLEKHIDPTYDIEKIHNISRSEIKPGVHFPTCQHLGCIYKRGKWICPKCGCESDRAHLKALRDYYLLYGPSITNQQFCEFLQFPSMDLSYKKLISLNLPSTGPKKTRIYQLSWDILQE